MSPRDVQPAGNAVSAPPVRYLKRSMADFMRWWGRHSFQLSANEARPQLPDALKDATTEFGARIWSLALDEAQDQLRAERNAVQKQVGEAQAKVANAELARGKAQSAVSQLEKRLASIEQARKETETKLSDSLERQKELMNEASAGQQARREQEQRLAAVVAREKDQQAQLAALKKSVDDKARETEALAARHQQQLERAKQHYNSMESRLAALLEENKSARQKL